MLQMPQKERKCLLINDVLNTFLKNFMVNGNNCNVEEHTVRRTWRHQATGFCSGWWLKGVLRALLSLALSVGLLQQAQQEVLVLALL